MLEALQDHGLRNWGQQMLATRALQSLAPHFLRAGIPVMPVKGLALGRWLYADLRDRGLRDIDLLVSPEQLSAVRSIAQNTNWPISEDRKSVGEITFLVDGVTIETHSAVCFPDLTGLLVQDLIHRACVDPDTFGFPVHHVDDVDHFVLLAASVLKDHFHHANPHQARDLALLWPRIAPRMDEFIARLTACGFVTGMHSSATFLVSQGLVDLAPLMHALRPRRRFWQDAALALLQRHPVPRPLAAATICWTNDRPGTRIRCLARLPCRAFDASA